MSRESIAALKERTAREKAALEAARAHVVRYFPVSPSLAPILRDSIVLALTQPVSELRAATEYTKTQECFADEWDAEFGPLWLGHGVHSAFLAGIRWARQNKEENNEKEDKIEETL